MIRRSRLIRVCAAPFILALCACIVAYIATGPTLALYFSGVAIVAILIPQLIAGRGKVETFFVAAAITDAIALVWLIALISSSTGFGQWLAAYIVLCAVAFAVTAISRHLGAALTTIATLVWLSWPIWLAPHASTKLAAILIPAHPLFALNRIFIDQGIWTQQHLMYDLTTLGQDIPFSLPSSILPCIVAHTLIGTALLMLARLKASSPAPAASSAPSAHP